MTPEVSSQTMWKAVERVRFGKSFSFSQPSMVVFHLASRCSRCRGSSSTSATRRMTTTSSAGGTGCDLLSFIRLFAYSLSLPPSLFFFFSLSLSLACYIALPLSLSLSLNIYDSMILMYVLYIYRSDKPMAT